MRSQNNTKPPYLFYSPKCENCIQLITLIKQHESMAEWIVPVDALATKREGKLPREIVKVPTILFDNQLKVGTEAFTWVDFQAKLRSDQSGNETVQNMPNQPMHNQLTNQPMSQNNQAMSQNMSNQPMKEPEAIDAMMDGISGSIFEGRNTKIPLEKSYKGTNFSLFDEKNANVDGLASIDPMDIVASNRNMPQKKTEEAATAQYEQIQKMRNQGF
jgi:hypothetical protein